MKKFYTLFISIFSLIFIDFSLSKTDLPVDSKNYLMGFDKFVKKAKDTKGQRRILLVGGSSLGWGVSSKTLTKNLGILTLNAGIHAGVGYTNYMRNLEEYIDKEKDLLVFSPEYGMDFRNIFFRRSKEFCEISLYTRNAYPLDCIGYSLNRLFLLRSHFPRETKEYRRDGFNDYGDYVYRKDKSKIEKLEDICKSINISGLERKYIPFLKKLQSKNYKLIYIQNVVPESNCTNKEELKKFHQILFKDFGVKNVDNFQLFLKKQYFHNSVYHLTEEGTEIKTKIFEKNLKKYLLN